MKLNKRVIILFALIIFVSSLFWLGSRYPELNQKASMSGTIKLSDSLNYEAVVKVNPADPLFKQILFSTINWLNTNKRGMTFGVLLAAIILTLMKCIRTKRPSGSLVSTIYGVLIGAPLGVCVNCAAPIAKGLYVAGSRAETALAAMFSSPTLNIVVITMAFTLFPVYMAVIKLTLTLLLIFAVVPLLTKHKFRAEQTETCNISDLNDSNYSLNESWLAAFGATALGLWKNFLFIVKTTVPLMFVGGFLGVCTAYTLPFDAITKGAVTFTGTLLVASVGLFLPVPMALDIVLTQALMIGGLPVSYVMVLMFTLGIYSIFAMSIVWTTISRTISILLFLILIFFGVGAGYIADSYEEWQFNRMMKIYEETISASKDKVEQSPEFSRKTVANNNYDNFPRASGLIGKMAPYDKASNVTIRTVSYRQEKLENKPYSAIEGASSGLGKSGNLTMPNSAILSFVIAKNGGKKLDQGFDLEQLQNNLAIQTISHQKRKKLSEKPFLLLDSYSIGLGRLDDFSMVDFIPPFYNGRGIAAGDFNNDGLQDIIIAEKGGVILFQNLGGISFSRIPTSGISFTKDTHIMVVAFVDLNNDGWLDIYLTTYGEGNYIFFNDGKNFKEPKRIKLPNSNAIYTNAAAFADVDLDGDLDIVQGNLFLGFLTVRPLDHSSNTLLINQNGIFREQDIPEPVVGETQTIFFSDINNDTFPDLMVGNDFEAPDYFFLGGAKGNLSKILKNTTIPKSTFTTMSFDSADLNNDLLLDVYIAQISGKFGTEEKVVLKDFDSYCKELSPGPDRDKCEKNIAAKDILAIGKIHPGKIAACKRLFGPDKKKDRTECMVTALMILSMRRNKPNLCKRIPDEYLKQKQLCMTFHKQEKKKRQLFDSKHTKQFANVLLSEIPQSLNYNVLLVATKEGKFVNRAKDMNVTIAGWCWNSKFADLDNDQWQDIYVANGTWFGEKRPSNIFFHNMQGKGFEHAESEFGLEDFMVVPSYVYLDMDNDGDIDIVTLPVNGPVKVYVNNENQNNSISFGFKDQKGNFYGIGNKVYIYYGKEDALHQVREVKAGGGYHSFDPPVVHFGLEKYKQVNRIKIVWSTGESSEIKKGLKANRHYIISRFEEVPQARHKENFGRRHL